MLSAVVLDLGDGSDFNAVIFSDHTATAADTEGRVAVGGNAQYPASYSVGGASIGEQISQSNGSRNDLVVQGNVTLPSGLVVVDYGNVKIGGSLSGAGSFSQGFGNTTSTGVSDFQNTIFDFSDVESKVRGYSTAWSNLAQTGTVNDEGWELTLSGANSTLNVFNITAANWDLTGTRVIDVPVGSTVIINISGSAVTNGGGDVRFGTTATDNLDPSNYRNNVIYNLFEATTIQSDYLLWEGSVFAPDATLTTNGGAINGQAFLDEVNQEGNFEFHNFKVDAVHAPVPEPSTYSLIFGALALSFTFRSRRK